LQKITTFRRLDESLNIQRRRNIKLRFLIFILAIAIIVLIIHIKNIINADRRLPSQTNTKYDRAVRGDIISADGYTITQSKKIYSASIYGESLTPGKRNLFVKLFSIYSHIPEKDIKAKMLNSDGTLKRGRIILSRNIDVTTAIYLKELAYKLKRLKVFRRVKNANGIVMLYGLDIVEIGEKRVYPLSDTLSPIIGYTKQIENNRYRRIVGIKGIERRYQKYLNKYSDGFITGKRDVSGTIILNSSSKKAMRKDGYSLHLNIPLTLQRMVEKIVDSMQKVTGAKEIIAGVMESKTGKIRALASSQRYDPQHIRQEDISKLIPKALRYAYEPGSVIKPITLAIALELHRVKINNWFDTHNGRMAISKRFIISDDEPFKSMSVTDIIVHSSNIGITQIGWKLSGKEMHDNLLKFGFNQKSGIDLGRESIGLIRSPKLLENRVNRATQSYGYGMKATFVQLLKAYNIFNNDGIALTPKVVEYLESADGKKYILKSLEQKRAVISPITASKIRKVLREVVKRGTGLEAQYPGLDIGGKTGTSHIAENNTYSKRYNSSFFGFANDKKGHKYTIGVLVIEPSFEKHFAAQSAVPTFKKIVTALADLGYLKPDLTIKQRELIRKSIEKRRRIIKAKRAKRRRDIKVKLKKARKHIRQNTKSLFKSLNYHKKYKKIDIKELF